MNRITERIEELKEIHVDNMHFRVISKHPQYATDTVNQLEFCKYETRGAEYETYIDKGFSGKNTNQSAFTRMMEDIRAGKIKRVIVYKLDRISRSILDFSNMMEIFQEYHVEFVSSTERFDTSTPIGCQGSNIINSASDYVGTNGIFLYKGINGDKTKKKQTLWTEMW